MLVADQPSAAERLQHEIGDRLAILLRSALTGDQALQHSWQATVHAAWSSTGRLADVSGPDFASFRPEIGRIVVLHPERPTAVSLRMGRNMEQRMVASVGASRARARKSALNEGLQDASSTAGQIELACECDDEECPARIVLSADEYAFLRRVPGYYAVSHDHVSPDDHVIVGDAGRFAIVE